jgi:hypothetical protein
METYVSIRRLEIDRKRKYLSGPYLDYPEQPKQMQMDTDRDIRV